MKLLIGENLNAYLIYRDCWISLVLSQWQEYQSSFALTNHERPRGTASPFFVCELSEATAEAAAECKVFSSLLQLAEILPRADMTARV